MARKPRVTVQCPRRDPDEKLTLTGVYAGLEINWPTAAAEHAQPRDGQ